MNPCLLRGVLPAVALTLGAMSAPIARADVYQPFGELRGYPSGAIVSAGLGRDWGGGWHVSAHGAYNIVERGSNGEFQNEEGGGFGVGATMDRYFAANQTGWFVGGRAELFFLDIDYRDPGGVRGSSDITVFQPTARGGYGWQFGGGRYGLTAGLSVGAEINVGTAGEDVGEGAILLGGLAFTFKP